MGFTVPIPGSSGLGFPIPKPNIPVLRTPRPPGKVPGIAGTSLAWLSPYAACTLLGTYCDVPIKKSEQPGQQSVGYLLDYSVTYDLLWLDTGEYIGTSTIVPTIDTVPPVPGDTNSPEPPPLPNPIQIPVVFPSPNSESSGISNPILNPSGTSIPNPLSNGTDSPGSGLIPNPSVNAGNGKILTDPDWDNFQALMRSYEKAGVNYLPLIVISDSTRKFIRALV